MKLLVGLVMLVPFGPAHLGSGDSVRPRDTESVIETIVPSPPSGVNIEVVGSDTFIRVSSVGHRIEVPGYQDEQYLRIAADGTVSINEASVTALLNGDRYGDVDMSSYTPSETPSWRVVSKDGTVMWHDHRSHWMSEKRPAPVDDEGTVQKWTVPMIIDGTITDVNGTLYLRDRASVMWWLLGLLAVVVTIGASIVNRMSSKVVLLVVSSAGVVTGMLQYLGLPEGARVTPILSAFSGLAVLMCVGAIFPWRTNAPIRAALAAGAASSLAIGAWMCADHVQAAYVPGLDAQWLVRGLVPVMLGAGIAGTLDGVIETLKRR